MYNWRIESSLDKLIIALCLDYDRRRRIIEERSATKRTDTEFRYYNFKIYEAASEIVGEREAEKYIKEIGKNIGYARSKTYVTESVYKSYKLLVKKNIAKKLHLI